MTLDEAIKYLEEMVEIGETYEVGKIVEENRQLLEWLKELKQLREMTEIPTGSGLDILALLEKTYTDFCECDGGEGWLKIDGKEYSTDAAYAIEGVSIFMEVFKQRLEESEEA